MAAILIFLALIAVLGYFTFRYRKPGKVLRRLSELVVGVGRSNKVGERGVGPHVLHVQPPELEVAEPGHGVEERPPVYEMKSDYRTDASE